MCCGCRSALVNSVCTVGSSAGGNLRQSQGNCSLGLNVDTVPEPESGLGVGTDLETGLCERPMTLTLALTLALTLI